MTALTPKMDLRYPTGTDRPCDGWQQINDLGDDIYAHLNTFDTRLTQLRTLPMVAVAWQSPTPQHIPASSGVTPALVLFNTVEQDDLQAADLIVDNTGFTLGMTEEAEGTYIYGFDIVFNGGVAAQPFPGASWFDIVLTPNTYNARALDADQHEIWDPVYPNSYFSGSALLPVNGSTRIQAGRLENNVGGTNVVFARLWAVRIGDF